MRHSVPVFVTLFFLIDVCKPQKADATSHFIISLACFKIFHTIDLAILTSLPVIELL
jgi:hypothetical protein